MRFFKLILVLFIGLSMTKAANKQSKFVLYVNLHADDFEIHISKLYNQFFFDEEILDYHIFSKAMKGYLHLKNEGNLTNSQFLTIIDYSRHCNDKRLWILDLYSKNVVINELVAHGKGSGTHYSNFFSNKHRSHASSIGFMITGEVYDGKHNHSLKLHGLESYFNSNVFDRGIVFHAANYVSNDYAAWNERIGRSHGCPAVNPNVINTLTELISGGSLVYSYFPNLEYLAKSSILNNQTYIPVEDLENLWASAVLPK